MQLTDKIYVAGHGGLVGSTILKLLTSLGYTNIITRSSKELDLRDHSSVREFFRSESPKYVFMAAAKVGGIHANNTYPAEFIYDNLSIQNNVIHESYSCGVSKLLFLGSSCIYPKNAMQPIREEFLLTGALEPTNEAYAVAKIAGIKMCEYYKKQYGCNYISVMPSNLYGPGDNYDLQNSHVLPALIRKFHEAKSNKAEKVVVWGTGSPRREFLHVQDFANACYFLMKEYNSAEIINVGPGIDHTIAEIAAVVQDIVGYKGHLLFDHSKPDGVRRKLLNVEKITALGWKPSINLKEGIQNTYIDFAHRYEYYISKKNKSSATADILK